MFKIWKLNTWSPFSVLSRLISRYSTKFSSSTQKKEFPARLVLTADIIIPFSQPINTHRQTQRSRFTGQDIT